jgi:hypothetical protein
MSNVLDEPNVVPAGRGAAWWSEGLQLFTSRFWTWIGIMFVYLILMALINSVPYVGDLGHWLLTPVFMGGIMIGCNAIDRGEPLRVSHLFEGFQGSHFVPLMIIGAVNIGLALAIGAIAAVGLLGGLKMADLAQWGNGDPIARLMGSLAGVSGTSLLMMLVILVIAAVFGMLNWFAPAVVALQGATAVEAMKASFKSCLRNWAPFLVYGLVAIVVGTVLIGVVVGIALLFGASAFVNNSTGGWVAAAALLFGLFMLVIAVFVLFAGPVVFGSTYAGYRDTLGGVASDREELVNPAYH